MAYLKSSTINGNLTVLGVVSASAYHPAGTGTGASLTTGSTYPITSSWANTASFALNGGGAGTSLSTGSTYPITSSWAQRAISSSYAVTTSYSVFSEIYSLNTTQSQFATTSILAYTASSVKFQSAVSNSVPVWQGEGNLSLSSVAKIYSDRLEVTGSIRQTAPVYVSASLLAHITMSAVATIYNGPAILLTPGIWVVQANLFFVRTTGATGSFSAWLRNETQTFIHSETSQATTTNVNPRKTITLGTVLDVQTPFALTASVSMPYTNAYTPLWALGAFPLRTPTGSSASHIYAYRIG